MMEDMIPMVEKAIDAAAHWPDNGWPVAFGNRQIEVNSLKAAESLLKVGLAPLPPAADQAELAAWTSVARVILNLHETITRS